MSPKTKFIYDEFNNTKGCALPNLSSIFALGNSPDKI